VRDCAGAVSIGQASGLTRRYRSGNQGAWLLQRDLLAFQATYLSVGESERFSCALPAGSRWPRSLEIAYSAMQQAIPLQG
jgi:hypothetical protein